MGINNEYGVPVEWMAFDIETIPMPGCEKFLVEPIEAPSNYKDPAKIKAYIEEKKARQTADAGLDLDLCEVVAIAVAFHNDSYVQTRETASESEMLDGFWRFARRHKLVGFNCLGFDLPVLLRRSLYLRVPSMSLSLDRYRQEHVIDLADLLTYHGKTTWRSLEFYATRFGVPYDASVKGEDIARLVADGQWEVIATHCLGDAETTRELAARVGAIQWERMPLSEDVAV